MPRPSIARVRRSLSAARPRLLGGLLPLRGSEVGGDVLAGITLAALGIPEVLGYARIAGMPLVTGPYTLLLPVLAFAVLGSSRHLVVGADSATAAILAGALTSVAAAGSPRYVTLAGATALVCGGLLLLARVLRLGFLANFLSRTVLLGFLTGVGVQVAAGQLPEMLGVHAHGDGTVAALADTVRHLGSTSAPTLIVSVAVLVVIISTARVTRRVPGALIAVVVAIAVSRLASLSPHGIALVGAIPRGLPVPSIPHAGIGDARLLLPTAASMVVVILAQSAATSQAYAARYEEDFDENTDLIGLGIANLAAGVTGTFVVNGSPTKTEMVDRAGGRSQLAMVVTAVVVLLVLLLLTGPLAWLPTAVLAAIVFLIGVELVKVRELRTVLRVRRDEFVVAVLTAAAVVFLGVEQGIVLAVVLSIIDHLRYSYHPRNVVIVTTEQGRPTAAVAAPGVRTEGSLVVYRFGSSLYYANAHSLYDDVMGFLGDGGPLTWFCLDAAAIGDIDYTAAAVLRRVHDALRTRSVRFSMSGVSDAVRAQLDGYSAEHLTAHTGDLMQYPNVVDVLAAYRQVR